MRIRQAVVTLTLFVSPAFSFAQQPIAPEPQTGNIIGTAIDVQGDAIPAASITLDGPTSADHSTTTSDDNGFFAFRNLRPAVPYHISINANGFAAWTSPDIVLKPGQQLDLAGIKLQISVVQTTVTALTLEQIATQQVEVAEKQRVLGFIPNFYVTYDKNPVPLTTKLKYKLAFRTSTDVINFAATAFFAGINQASNNSPDYVQGAKGYAERFGANYTDSFTDIMIGAAVLPSLLHQDPRYFYQGTGTIKSRIMHAISSPFLCRGDNGRMQVNYSSLGGDLASGSISNIYYPASDRGAGLLFENDLITIGGRVASALSQEFIFRRFTPSAKKQAQP